MEEDHPARFPRSVRLTLLACAGISVVACTVAMVIVAWTFRDLFEAAHWFVTGD